MKVTVQEHEDMLCLFYPIMFRSPNHQWETHERLVVEARHAYFTNGNFRYIVDYARNVVIAKELLTPKARLMIKIDGNSFDYGKTKKKFHSDEFYYEMARVIYGLYYDLHITSFFSKQIKGVLHDKIRLDVEFNVHVNNAVHNIMYIFDKRYREQMKRRDIRARLLMNSLA